MTPQLPDDLAKAAGAHPDQPLRTESKGRVFYIMTDQNLHQIIDDNTRSALKEGLADVEAGRVDDWNVDDIKQRGRQRLTENG